MAPNRRPGTAKVEDLLTKADGSPTALALRLEKEGKSPQLLKRWRVRYVDLDGKQKTASFQRKVDAEIFKQHIITDLVTGKYVAPEDAQLQVEHFYPAYLLTLAKRKPSYQKTRKSHWKNHVKPRWAATQLGQITTQSIQMWVDESLEDGKSYDTVYQAASVLRGVLQVAVNAGKLHSNPATNIAIGSRPENRVLIFLMSR